MASLAGGMIASAVIGGLASKKAAGTTADAQMRAAQMKMQAGEKAAGIMQGYYDTTRQDFAPYTGIGQYGAQQYQNALENYNMPTLQQAGIPTLPQASLPTAPNLPQFHQPTEADMLQDPSYQWRLNQGIEATQRAMTRSGGAWGGQRGIALMDYAQNAASQEYGNIYSRAVQNYGLDYNRAIQGYGLDYQRSLDLYNANMQRSIQGYQMNQEQALNQYNAQVQTEQDYLNRLQGISTQGQNLVANLGSISSGYAGGIASAYTGAATGAGANIVGAGQAEAAGTMGIGRAIGSIANVAGGYYGGLYTNDMIKSLYGNQ